MLKIIHEMPMELALLIVFVIIGLIAIVSRLLPPGQRWTEKDYEAYREDQQMSEDFCDKFWH